MKISRQPAWIWGARFVAVGLWLGATPSAVAQSMRVEATEGVQLAGPDACARDPVCWFHAERARELSKQGLLSEALKEYQAAFGLQPMPRLIFNVARMQQKMGRLDEALRSYELYINLGAEGNLEFAARARGYIDEIDILTEPAPPPLLPPPPPPPPPLYRRWWLWTVVGLGTAGLTAGILAAALPRPIDPTQNIPIFRPF